MTMLMGTCTTMVCDSTSSGAAITGAQLAQHAYQQVQVLL